MLPTDDELEAAKENLRNLFFALAFDPDNKEAADQADVALRELEQMLSPDESRAAAMPGFELPGPAAR